MAYRRIKAPKVLPVLLMHFQIAEWMLQGPPRTRLDMAEAFLIGVKESAHYFHTMVGAGLMVNGGFRNGKNRGHEFVPTKRLVPYTEAAMVVETCTSGHRFARLSGHPKKASGEWACPFCLMNDLEREREVNNRLLQKPRVSYAISDWQLQSLMTKSIAG